MTKPTPAPRPKAPTKEKELFQAQVSKGDGCWLWTGRRLPTGYGQLYFRGKTQGAHRVSYSLFVGVIPSGMFVCHSCDNPPCVNPDHLFLGNAKENARDMAAKGRVCLIGKSRIATCPSGHSYSGDNLWVDKKGWRYCRICKRTNNRNWRLRERILR